MAAAPYVTKEMAIDAMRTDPKRFERVSILKDRVNVKLIGAENMTYFADPSRPDGEALLNELLAALANNGGSCIIFNKRDGWRGVMKDGVIDTKIGLRGAVGVVNVAKDSFNPLAAPPEVPADDNASAAAAVLGTDSLAAPIIWEFAGLRITVNSEIPDEKYAGHIPGDNGYMPDEDLMKKALVVIMNEQPLLLEGHTGCGKTEAIKWLAHKTNNPLLILQGSEDMETASLLGHLEIDESGTFWVDGLITTAVKKGFWLYFDEVNACPAGVKIALHGLLDDNRHLILADHRGECVKAHPNFRFLAACNPADHGGYLGAGFENIAFLNRFMKIRMPYMAETTENRLLKKLYPRADAELTEKIVKAATLTRVGFIEGKIGNVVTTRDLKMLFANAALLPLEDALCILGGKFGAEDCKRFYDAFTLHLGALPILKSFLGIS